MKDGDKERRRGVGNKEGEDKRKESEWKMRGGTEECAMGWKKGRRKKEGRG